MVECYMVTWDGRAFKKGYMGPAGKREAEAFAERWQGKRYKSGMLKHGDKLDYFEVKRDRDAEKELRERLDECARGNPQKITMQQWVRD
jgi:hypothetical protein